MTNIFEVGWRFQNLYSNGGISFNLNGHSPIGIHAFNANPWMFFVELPPKYLDALNRILCGSTSPVKKFVRFDNFVMGECSHCGKKLDFETNGLVFRVIGDRCVEEHSYSFGINIPSGKMVIGSDLDYWFRIIGKYNTYRQYNRKKLSLHHARFGLAHFYLKLDCPEIYKVDERNFLVGKIDSMPSSASFVTEDWCDVVDFDEFVKRLKRVPEADRCEHIVHCEPGFYSFNISQDEVRIHWEKSPIKCDYYGDWRKQEFTAEQVIGNALQTEYFSIDERKPERIMRLADRLLLVDETRIFYHPNGWISFLPEINPKETVDIPKFQGRFDWFGLNKYSLIFNAAGIGERQISLNPSFAKLAINVLENIAQHGLICNDEVKSKENIEMAKRCLTAMKKKYKV